MDNYCQPVPTFW